MLCVFPFHSGDAYQLLELLRWIESLGKAKTHDALLVADAQTSFEICARANRQAKTTFREVRCISNGKSVSGWPEGPNSLFWSAATYIYHCWKQPWLLIETDAVPLIPGWLGAIQAEYDSVIADFMGDVYSGIDSGSGLPVRAVSGIAVYPGNVPELLKQTKNEAWDIVNREFLLEHTHATGLIKHLYGTKELPPTFVERKDNGSPLNAFEISSIRPEAVLFHRNKDGSLMQLLRKRLGTPYPETSINVVFPVCNKDAHLLKRNLQWMYELDGKGQFDAICTFDPSLKSFHRESIKAFGEKAFRSWREFLYPTPRKQNWPDGPNWAFQHTARHMKSKGRPWLWMEADAWPIKPRWLHVLEREYILAGKPVMGPVVPNMGHVNGVAIYPANFCDISVHAMNCTGVAWDYACSPDIVGKVHDAIHLMQHAWGMGNGRFTERDGNGPPTFSSPLTLNWLSPTAVMFHRCKDCTLIDQLRKQNYANRDSNRIVLERPAVSAA